MTNLFLVQLRAKILKKAVQERGGAYITPEENAQPNRALKIAFINLDGIQAWGNTEADAQSRWLTAKYQAELGAAA